MNITSHKPSKHFLLFIAIFFCVGIPTIIFLFYLIQAITKAAPIKANITIDVKNIISPLPYIWKALAQGGEEQGVQMLESVIPQVSVLSPRYIRLDHIYDFYNVVSRDDAGTLVFNWDELDKTVCDIYHTGARPFFALGYMPPVISSDGTLIGKPGNWNEWALLIQKTIERYSGRNTRLCGQVTGEWMNNIYYEVWNEPDLESFGKWSKYGGDKDYRTLYFYSSQGAKKAENVYHFFLGGPVTTASYKNWFISLLDHVLQYNLKLDFLSWHHYSKNTNDYTRDMTNLEDWLAPDKYASFRGLPKIISEWGYDSDTNPISETNVGAAHTVSAIRNLIEQKLEMAFAFDIKDGPSPRWGILTNNGIKKPRFYALEMLNVLQKFRLGVSGEGTFVQAIASTNGQTISVVLVNFDINNKNIELVPVTFSNIDPGSYSQTLQTLGQDVVENTQIEIIGNEFQRKILMPPNSVVSIELMKR